MEKQKVIEILKCQLKKIAELKQRRYGSQDFKEWRRDTSVKLINIFKGDNGSHENEFGKINFLPKSLSMINDNTQRHQNSYISGLETCEAVLKSMITEVEEWGVGQDNLPSLNTISIIENLCKKFHLVARQLRDRHDNRSTVEIEDEYDVQDLLHALLTLHFDDIRPEEWTPSYAGSSSRMDFLLKNEQIVIETKKSRKGLGAKEVGEQLIVDIQKYQTHPDCKTLICFVYDPEGRIPNPKGIENDLNRVEGDLTVKVIISPTGM
jgi:hypothetical protein